MEMTESDIDTRTIGDGRDGTSRPRPVSPMARTFGLGVVLSLFLIAACGGSGGEIDAGAENAAGAVAAEGPTDVSQTGLSNVARPRPGLLTSAQPSQSQVDALRSLGYEHFISLRPAAEPGAGWEEEYLTDENFDRIPIAGPEDLTRENVEALDRVLAEAGDARTVLYCASSNRVGALMALRALWVEGVDPDSALALGREAGLTSLEPAVRDLLAGGG